MTEVMSCADPAVVGQDQYPLPHCDWERCRLLKRFWLFAFEGVVAGAY